MVDSATGAAAGPSGEPPPVLSVVIPTRGRAAHIAACVESILACTGPRFELIIVDQSEGGEIRDALAPFAADPRLRYISSGTRGCCIARNLGIEASRGQIHVCTDDDCIVPQDWLARIEATFASEPATDVLCGKVVIPPEVEAGGFGAFFLARFPETTFDTMALRDFGITGNMAFRRRTVETIGAFDVFLGAGAPLGSAGEPDFIFRAVRARLRVRNDPALVVEHLGVKRGAEIGVVWKRYHFGTGAALFKQVRLLDPQGARVLLGYFRWFGFGALKNLVRGRRPFGFGTLLALLRGAGASLRFEVDPATRLFRERGR